MNRVKITKYHLIILTTVELHHSTALHLLGILHFTDSPDGAFR